MQSKRPSLKEFYATHGPKQSPSRGHGHGTGAHDDRADDQGLHHRLAADCSLLDNGKPHPQRGSGRVKGGGGRRHGDRHGRRGDRSDVGDVEQQPQQQSHSQPNRSFCATRGRQRDGGRPAARHGNAAAGRESGQCSVADVPPAGVLPGPDAVGGRAPGYSGRSSSGSFGTPTGSSNSYSQGPRHGHGPPLPSSRNYANHPYGMPPGAGGMLPGRQWEQAPGPQGHLPAPGSAFQASPAGSHCSPAGCGYGPPGAAMGPVPLPPPPPRRSPSGRHPGPRSGVAAAPPTAAGPAAGAEGLGASSAQPTPAARGAAPAQGAAVPEAGAQAADAAGGCAGRTGSPFAAAPAALEAPAAAPAAVCPKNAFAERLAQRAMANAKSSVLAGTSSSSSAISRSPSLTRSGSAGAPVAHKPLPATGGASPPVFAAIPDISSASSSPTDHGSGPFVKPALLRGGRPELKPGSIHPLEAVPASGNYSSTSSDSGDAPADHGGSGSAASSLSGGRPRLHLLPRGSSGMAASSGGGGGAVKASVFGGARPREEVLRERGQDPADVDAAMGHSWTGEGGGHAPRAGGGTADAAAHDYNRSGAAGKEDCWHTVAGHGRRRLADEGAPGLLDGSFDPFFGDSSFRSGPRTSGGLGALPPPQAFGRDIMRAGHGGRHGSSGSFGGAGSAHAQAQGDGGYNNNDDDDAIFMRALPTRQKPLAL